MSKAGRKKKERLDVLLVEKGLVQSREKAQALIMEGRVAVNVAVETKSGKAVSVESSVTVREGPRFVGRGGLKLSGVLDELDISVGGLTVLDIGSSTGGFTDCLLKRGAKKVFAVDVGKGLLDSSLRNDPRVTLLEGKNFRYMSPQETGERVDLAVIDVSFISLDKILPNLAKGFLKEGALVLSLIKPQFEVGKGEVGKGGIVRDPEKHRRVIDKILDFSKEIGFKPLEVRQSRVTGAKGNKEFWALLSY